MDSYLDALRDGNSFDWICQYGHTLSKTELVSIIKELTYAIYAFGHSTGDEQTMLDMAADELSCLCGDEVNQ